MTRMTKGMGNDGKPQSAISYLLSISCNALLDTVCRFAVHFPCHIVRGFAVQGGVRWQPAMQLEKSDWTHD
jgi:hypothetical protein